MNFQDAFIRKKKKKLESDVFYLIIRQEVWLQIDEHRREAKRENWWDRFDYGRPIKEIRINLFLQSPKQETFSEPWRCKIALYSQFVWNRRDIISSKSKSFNWVDSTQIQRKQRRVFKSHWVKVDLEDQKLAIKHFHSFAIFKAKQNFHLKFIDFNRLN